MSTSRPPPSDDFNEELEGLNHQQQRPMSEPVLESLRQYILAEQLKAIRRATVPLAEAHGFLTFEDIFKVVS